MRSLQFSGGQAPLLASALLNVCKTGNKTGTVGTRTTTLPDTICDVSIEEAVRDTSKTSVLAAQPLTGIWATAPYLHNGSVPTLRALLLPSTRPAAFYRGGRQSVDTLSVGFTTNRVDGARLYDTKTHGKSNGGRATEQMLGKDWSKDPAGLEALLDYINTL